MYAAEFEKTKNSQAIRDRLQSAFDEITPLDLPDPCLPSCCDEDAWLIEPAEIDYGWIAAMVASVEERYGEYGLNELMNRLDEALEADETEAV